MNTLSPIDVIPAKAGTHAMVQHIQKESDMNEMPHNTTAVSACMSRSMDPGRVYPREDGGRDDGGDVKAFVVFTGQADRPWLRWLKAGYRHCFVLLHDGGRWISLDPMLNHTDVQVHNVPPDFDLPRWLETRGNIVVRTQLCRTHKKAAPIMPFTCVEAVKRVLGIHDFRILTPWQLYRHLTTVKKASATCLISDPMPVIKASHSKSFPQNKGLVMGGVAWAA